MLLITTETLIKQKCVITVGLLGTMVTLGDWFYAQHRLVTHAVSSAP